MTAMPKKPEAGISRTSFRSAPLADVRPDPSISLVRARSGPSPNGDAARLEADHLVDEARLSGECGLEEPGFDCFILLALADDRSTVAAKH